MIEYAEAEGIAVNRCGKVILATSEEQLTTADKLLRNANQNQIAAFKIDKRQVKAIEPYAASGVAAILCPDTGVIDSASIVQRMGDKLVHTSQGDIGYWYLVNCAGAYADVVAKLFGVGRDYALVPFKGIDWKLSEAANPKVRANIYPVPDVSMPFLGVHLTRVINGDVYVSPSAIPALGRKNYGVFQGSNIGESLAIGYRLAGMYLRDENNFRKLTHVKLGKYKKENFLVAAQKLIPSLRADDMVPTPKSGIRPQLVNINTRKLEMDYILERSGDSLHVLNAISLAFTGSLAFAELIVDKKEC